MQLTPEQLDQFREDGVIVINDVFTQEEIDQLHTACEECDEIRIHLRQEFGGFKFHLLEVAAKHPAFMDAAKNKNIIELIKPLIGEDIQLQHSKLAVKNPGIGKGTVDWHQDFAYLPHTNTSLVSIMIAMDDITMENGGMLMVRGSHKLGPLNHSDAFGFIGACTESHLWANPSNLIEITPKRGGISIHHCLTVHSSPDNVSQKPRHSIIFQYRADDAMQLADGIWQDTGEMITGQRRRRVRCENLQFTLPTTAHNRYGDENPYGPAWQQVGPSAKAEIMTSLYEKREQKNCSVQEAISTTSRTDKNSPTTNGDTLKL